METQNDLNNNNKYLLIFIYISIMLLSSFIFNTPREIILGLKDIILSTSILLTDYMEYANIGTAFMNSSILMMITLFIAKYNKIDLNGPVIASIFTVGGFGLFGKNLYNIWSIFLGIYLYSRIKKRKFKDFIVIAFFGTALGPVISQISFGLDLSLTNGVILGNLAGVIIGLIMPPLAGHFVSFHKGYNLYNIGFTAGIIGTLFMSLLRGFGFDHHTILIELENKNRILGTYFLLFFGSMVLVGWYLNGKGFKGFKELIQESGAGGPDFISKYGTGLCLINMGILGVLSIIYVLLVKGQLNGLTIGGVFTIAGFGVFGKHIRNTIPVVLGVYIGTLFKIWEANSAGILLAALFGTTLAPIAGSFGILAGIIAGILHVSMVSNTGYLHGGMNLYNNGLAGGIVAAIMVPLIEDLNRTKKNN